MGDERSRTPDLGDHFWRQTDDSENAPRFSITSLLGKKIRSQDCDYEAGELSAIDSAVIVVISDFPQTIKGGYGQDHFLDGGRSWCLHQNFADKLDEYERALIANTKQNGNMIQPIEKHAESNRGQGRPKPFTGTWEILRNIGYPSRNGGIQTDA
ncbi:hypothetical protein AVEN_46952-1 [Araneus ventricosus]|uniref:Uncharacterized protein n=1 Tax=Araneus ventricosus TaxID=182803 RepID=A0A4Y2FPT6_ARAVE|nr:hypothetical protein AVEN_46952-1 [Araneus ventricosus]